MLCISSNDLSSQLGSYKNICEFYKGKKRKEKCQLVYKPGSVWRNLIKTPRDSHSSGTDVTTRLVQPTRMTGPEIGCKQSLRVIPIRSCSRWGLPCHIHYWMRGGLLPRLFTLTCMNRRYISVALSLRLPSPDVIRHRYSMEPGLSSPFTFRY